MKATLEGTRCRVMVQSDWADVFAVKRGLKQGGLFCLLINFNLTLEIAISCPGIQTKKTLATGTVQIQGFTDYLGNGHRHSYTCSRHFYKSENSSEENGLDAVANQQEDVRSIREHIGGS